MAHEPVSPVLRLIRTIAAGAKAAALSDRQLLQKFTAERDEAAFAALVRRHGPLVRGVCRRLLRHAQDAEDIFQATFLVLARKAGLLPWRESIGNWLYEVAYRLAAEAKVKRARRQAREREAGEMAARESVPEEDRRELYAVLDEELHRLPANYRAALVLCYLEGKPRAEAARQLGCPLGTLKHRLERARALLQARLTRRGVTLSTAGLVAALAPGAATAEVPALLALATAKAASAFAAGSSVAAGGISAKAVALAEGALKAMLVSKLQIVTVWAVAVGLVVAGAGRVARQVLVAQAPEGKAVEPAPPGRPRAESREPKAVPRADRYGDPLPEGALARLGTVRFRHGFMPYGLGFSPDGKTLASGGVGRGLCLWDVTTGRELHVLDAGGVHVSVAFSPDGKTLASSGSMDSLWEVATGRRLRQANERHRVRCVTFAPDGQSLAWADEDGSIRLADAATGQELRQLQGHAGVVFSLAISPDGKTLASAGQDKTVRLWNPATGQEVRRLDGHQDMVRAVRFSPDGKVLASAGHDQTVRLWDPATGRERLVLGGKLNRVHAVAFFPDGKTLASAGMDRRIHLWDVATGKELRSWEADTSVVVGVECSPDGKTLASVGMEGCAVRLWEATTGRDILPSGGHLGGFIGLAFAPDGKALFSVGWDRRVLRWDLASGREDASLGKPLSGGWPFLALSPDSWTLAAVGEDNRTIWVWDTATGRELRKLQVQGAKIESFAFSPDGRRMACPQADGEIALWDVQEGKALRRFQGHKKFLACAVFSPDGKLLASAGADQTVRLWDVASGREIRRWDDRAGANARVAFSPDGRSLATATGAHEDTSIRIWDVATGREIHRLEGHPKQVTALAYSPDGRLLASGGWWEDNSIRLWETASGQEVRRFAVPHSGVLSLAFSADGRTLASGGCDTTILLWDVAGRPDGHLRKGRLTGRELEAHWVSLVGEDAAKAYQDVWDLAAAPKLAVPFLHERLRPPSRKADPQRVERCITELDSPQFAVRERAARALEQFGEAAEPALRRALAGQPTLETRRRLEQLIARQEKQTQQETLRWLRAIVVLEATATPEARRLLQGLTEDGGKRSVRDEAKASLERLARRRAASPE
jgi:RNA polymerase sigma factor (sigma-70 family)